MLTTKQGGCIMQNLQVVEVQGQRVLTTKQIAELYDTEIIKIQQNFRNNKKKYQLGKHYIEVSGEELKEMKRTSEIHSSLKQVKHLYLWTEKGALLHAKSLNTDKAWEVYDYLVDFYFRVKEEKAETAQGKQASEKKAVIPVNTRTEKVPKGIELKIKKVYSMGRINLEIGEKTDIFVKLIHLVEKLRGEVRFVTFESKSEGMMVAASNWGNLRIGIRSEMNFDKYIYNIAYELAHYFLHYDKGDTVISSKHEEYTEQADRGAKMLIMALAVEGGIKNCK